MKNEDDQIFKSNVFFSSKNHLLFKQFEKISQHQTLFISNGIISSGAIREEGGGMRSKKREFVGQKQMKMRLICVRKIQNSRISF